MRPIILAAVSMSHRSYLRALSRRNRRAWAEQRVRLAPRVAIGAANPNSAVPQSAITICRARARTRLIHRLCIFS